VGLAPRIGALIVERLNKEGLAAVEPRVSPVKHWRSAEQAWVEAGYLAQNPIGVAGISGYFAGRGATEAKAIEKWHALAEKSRVKMEAWEVDLDLYGSTARNKAPFASKVAPSGDWVSAFGKANVNAGDSAIVWGHGRYRHGVVTNVSPEPADPRDGGGRRDARHP
jgi:hypothetical protein